MGKEYRMSTTLSLYRMTQTLSLGFLLLLIMALPARAAQPEVIAKVVSVTPEAQIHRLGKVLPMTVGAPLQRVDSVSTGQKGKAQIVFNEKTTLSIDPNTRVSLENFNLSPEDTHLYMRMASGSARLVSGGITKISPNALTVFTPMATIGIRGTDLTVVADPAKTTIIVNNIGEKDIRVTNMITLERSVLNKPGQALVVTPDGNVPRMATAAEKAEALRLAMPK